MQIGAHRREAQHAAKNLFALMCMKEEGMDREELFEEALNMTGYKFNDVEAWFQNSAVRILN